VSELEERALDVLRALVPGEVVSYGDVAEDAGFPGRARAVGHLLATTTIEVPWWRVVTSNGRLVPGHEAVQAQRLRAEGARIASGRVVEAPLGRFSRPETPWPPEPRERPERPPRARPPRP
jgi:methylated-DNA-protein-cysteine methyltransferase-like protein